MCWATPATPSVETSGIHSGPIMNRLLRLGTLFFCLGASAPALAQTYDDSDVPGNSGNCRAVVGQAEIDGTAQQVVGRACLQPDGTWQFVQSPDGDVMWKPGG